MLIHLICHYHLRSWFQKFTCALKFHRVGVWFSGGVIYTHHTADLECRNVYIKKIKMPPTIFLFYQHMCSHNVSSYHVSFQHYKFEPSFSKSDFKGRKSKKKQFFKSDLKNAFSNPIWKITNPKKYISYSNRFARFCNENLIPIQSEYKYKPESEFKLIRTSNPNPNTNLSNSLSEQKSEIKPEPMSEP